jgi:2-phospho-L-lactate guanylyltransferase
VADDVNESLRVAAEEAHRRWPDIRPVAVCADLPALHPDDLDAALLVAASAPSPAFVADRDGAGTTLYSAPHAGFAPHFGPGSRAAHLTDGSREIEGDLPSLRRDVDDSRGLAAAVELGLGVHTRLALLG